MDEVPIYRFKWSNYTLDRYLRERRGSAERLRGEAMVLMKRADQIEHEAVELEAALLPAERPPEPVQQPQE